MKIIGTGSAIPKQIVTNDMLSEFLDTSDSWIYPRTGIKFRHVISDENLEDMAVEAALKALDSGEYGIILRAKGILPASDGTWIHFDFVPEEHNIRTGPADVTGKLCVIGSKLDEQGIAKLFGV